ncbi:MAG: GDP-fucose synthetase [Candidatus Omnitrophica bacterium CG11_big_fil_rev_8_21_14_0_20_42_13]|uniref:GDP-L-fucose synthase n=1 Tax=Candidatus Ghiorseimicrobium undicola TaxID=1974746 RepID=A0A2H0LYX2_9BACT|nr:MAG: GDP-fucose synthetase [Candidatus Omnitrophica bacterium CG11_big_fil_rev_8_21_14_0_20_42_13]
MDKASKILVFGAKGLIGAALARRLRQGSFKNLILADSDTLELDNRKKVYDFFAKTRPDYCIIAPIKEGGIVANIRYPAELIYQNLSAQTNIIDSAWRVNVAKLIYLASSCVYPKDCRQPIKEEYLMSGPLELTNAPYAAAKISGIEMCKAYNLQYNTRFISVVPATAYGPGDNFDLNTSHVIPALLAKFHAAKINNTPYVTIWGSGKPKREFIYADDLADAVLFLMRQGRLTEVVNIGTGVDVSISRLAQLIKRTVGFMGKIKFDNEKPDGVARKLLDSGLLFSLGWRPRVSLAQGLLKAYGLYKKSIC